MRTAIFACVGLLIVAPLARAQMMVTSREESLRSIAVSFDLGDTITFRISPATGIVRSIEARVLGTTYSVPLGRCIPLEGVRFDTLKFMLGAHDRRKEGTFTFIFNMGTPQFGELPLVQLNFHKGRFVGPLLTNKTGPDSSSASSLCRGVPAQAPP